MEDAFIVNGGKPLVGTVRLSGAKNVALKTIIAALLFDEKVTLQNIPRISDVIELMHLIKSIGGHAEFIDTNIVEITGSSVNTNKVELLHSSKIRASFLLFAPLLNRFKECYVPNPGGCRIGARPIDRIIDGMRQLGVDVEYDSTSGYYNARVAKDIGGTYTFPKPTHTGTDLLILLSVRGNGMTTIENAAVEPEIDELIEFLNVSGAQIRRNNSTIIIEGVQKLSAKSAYTIGLDRNEAVTFAVLGIASQGSVEIEIPDAWSIKSFLDALEKTGAGVEKKSSNILRFYYRPGLKSYSIETAPHPGFMTDWQPNWAVLMTQAQGETIIHERIFENRFAYVNDLKRLGASVDFVSVPADNPESFYHFQYDENKHYLQAIKIIGPTPLHNGVLTMSDLRAGASLIIATLIAKGESVIQGASILERGYENFCEKVNALGGDIIKV